MFALGFIGFKLQLQCLLRFGPYACFLHPLAGGTLAPLRVLTCALLFSGYCGTELEVVEVTEHKVVHPVVLRLHTKGNLGSHEFAALDPLKGVHPKGCIK